MGTDDYQTLLSLNIATVFWNDTLMPQVFIFGNLSGECWFMPQIYYIYRTNWQFGITANILTSHNKIEPYFGIFRDNDEIAIWVKWSF